MQWTSLEFVRLQGFGLASNGCTNLASLAGVVNTNTRVCPKYSVGKQVHIIWFFESYHLS